MSRDPEDVFPGGDTMRKSCHFCGVFIVSALLFSCAQADGKGSANAPEKHVIPADASMPSVNGADAFAGSLDHTDSAYYVINDYYNMTSHDSLHILSHYETFQQTTEYSCGCAAALMTLFYYGNHSYNEMEICRMAQTDSSKGTSVEGLASFFEAAGLAVDMHADSKPRFKTIEECEAYLLDAIGRGAPVLVDWVDWAGHWRTIIGIDTSGTDSPYDDVLIMADSYDVTDHYQDGYNIVPLARFFEMWREGTCTQNAIPYEQPFVTAYKD